MAEDSHLHAKERGLKRNSPAATLISGFRPPELGANKRLSLWHLLEKPELTKTGLSPQGWRLIF